MPTFTVRQLPVCHYVVCASLCVRPWWCQRVSCRVSCGFKAAGRSLNLDLRVATDTTRPTRDSKAPSRRQWRVSPCNLLSHGADREQRHKSDTSVKTVGAPVLNERPSQLSSGCSSKIRTVHITIYTFNWKALITLNTFITEKEKWASVPVYVGSHSSLLIKAVCRLHTHKLDHFTERPSENCYCTLPTIYILPFKCCKQTQIWNYPQ